MWILVALAAATAGGQSAPDRSDLQAMFEMMDRNGDGYITANEAPRVTRVRAASVQTGAARANSEWIAGHDLDGDGRVSQAEFVGGAEAGIAQQGR